MRAAFLLLLPALLAAAELKIDHVTVAGSDLKSMQAGLTAIGIATVYGGAHANGVTEMALVSFPDGSYLEAIALQPGADPAAAAKHEWARFLKERAIPCAWALQADRLDAEVNRLRAAGVDVSTPVRAGRRRPDGVQLEWETVNLGAEDRGTFFPFLIHDFTPRTQRAFPQGRPVTREFTGVSRVVVAVRNLDQAIERYRKAFGLPAAVKQVDRDFGAELAGFGESPVVLAAPVTADSWIAKRIAAFGEGPCAFLLSPGRPGRQAKWFGHNVSWADSAKLGWRLGFERR